MFTKHIRFPFNFDSIFDSIRLRSHFRFVVSYSPINRNLEFGVFDPGMLLFLTITSQFTISSRLYDSLLGRCERKDWSETLLIPHSTDVLWVFDGYISTFSFEIVMVTSVLILSFAVSLCKPWNSLWAHAWIESFRFDVAVANISSLLVVSSPFSELSRSEWDEYLRLFSRTI